MNKKQQPGWRSCATCERCDLTKKSCTFFKIQLNNYPTWGNKPRPYYQLGELGADCGSWKAKKP